MQLLQGGGCQRKQQPISAMSDKREQGEILTDTRGMAYSTGGHQTQQKDSFTQEL